MLINVTGELEEVSLEREVKREINRNVSRKNKNKDIGFQSVVTEKEKKE